MEENLRQRLTLFGLTSIAVGSCIGSGIFVTPGQIASALGNEWLVLLVWLLGGGIALCGALTFAELGGLFPRSGGVYVYLREAFGELTAFLYGWVILLVINTGALAGLCVAFAEYMSVFFPTMSHGDKTAFAAATMAFLTVVNMRGVHISQGLANLFMVLKLAAIAGIIAVGVCFYDPAHTPNTWRLATDMPDNLPSALLDGGAKRFDGSFQIALAHEQPAELEMNGGAVSARLVERRAIRSDGLINLAFMRQRPSEVEIRAGEDPAALSDGLAKSRDRPINLAFAQERQTETVVRARMVARLLLDGTLISGNGAIGIAASGQSQTQVVIGVRIMRLLFDGRHEGGDRVIKPAGISERFPQKEIGLGESSVLLLDGRAQRGDGRFQLTPLIVSLSLFVVLLRDVAVGVHFRCRADCHARDSRACLSAPHRQAV
jgi:hypothetical protein